MEDPLAPLFGVGTLKLFQSAELKVVHGPIARFPEWMRGGLLSSIEELADQHKGPLQIAQGRTNAAPRHASDFVGEGGQAPVSGIRPSSLLRLGLSVHFGGLGDMIPEASAFLRGIEAQLSLGKCMPLSAFANAPGSGLPFHHDAYDQLLIHLVGEKKFGFIRERDADHPRLSYSPSAPPPPDFAAVYRNRFRGSEQLEEMPCETVTLRPGSCVFIPAGTWHRTEEQDQPCLSLTTGARGPSRWDLVREALGQLTAQSPEWRAPVYGGLRSGAEEPLVEVSRLMAELAQKIPEITAADLRESWELTQVRDGELGEISEAIEFSHFVRLPSSHCRELESEGDTMTVAVRLSAKTKESVLEFDEAARPLFQWLKTRSSVFSIDELTKEFEDFEEEDIRFLVAQLAKVGFLRPAFGRRWQDL